VAVGRAHVPRVQAAAGRGGAAGLTRALARRALQVRYGELPDGVRALARACLLDWFGVTLGGALEPAPSMVLEALTSGSQRSGAASGGATLVGRRERLPELQAALVNGTASHVLDFDDVNLGLPGHASVAVLAAALALAEQLDASIEELTAAFVAGYETACRVAAAVGPEPYLRGFHATGTVGTFGAAAACARLLSLDDEQAAVALGLAATQAAGAKASLGTMAKSLHAGKACENGLLAALLAARGFTANAAAIEAEQGFAALCGGGCDVAAALAEPARGWHLLENLFKYHATCFFTHSALEGLGGLRRDGRVRAQDVESVTLHVSELELGACAVPEPRTGLEVKFSIAHLAAMALLDRDTSVIDDADARDADVCALRERVQLVDDGEARAPTRVDVLLGGGERVHASADVNAAARDLDAQELRLAHKFTALAEPMLGGERAHALREAICAPPGAAGAPAGVRELTALAVP
jgi:2-methylcitrate dehydratase PrpD